MKNILLKRKGAVGDVLMLTPIIKRLHVEGNEVYVRTDCGEVLKNSPYVRACGPKDLKPDGGKYHRIINLDLAYEKRPYLHIVDAYSKMVFGDENTPHQLQMFDSVPDLVSVTEKLLNANLPDKKFIVIHMGVGWENRTFSIEFWKGIVNALSHKHHIICVGKGADYRVQPCIDFTNKLTLHELYHLIAMSKLFIGPDSGPLHIAQCTQKPCIGLYTCAKPMYRATSKWHHAVTPKEFSGEELSCFGCLHDAPPPVVYIGCRRGDFACVRECTSPEMVVDRINHVLSL